jgi:hypothetical protein
MYYTEKEGFNRNKYNDGYEFNAGRLALLELSALLCPSVLQTDSLIKLPNLLDF